MKRERVYRCGLRGCSYGSVEWTGTGMYAANAEATDLVHLDGHEMYAVSHCCTAEMSSTKP